MEKYQELVLALEEKHLESEERVLEFEVQLEQKCEQLSKELSAQFG